MIRIKLIVICCFFGITSLRAQIPVPEFSASTTSGCGPLSVHFTDQSTNNPNFWAWDFGNGQISSKQSPDVTFNNPGTYTVTLIAKNSSGANSIRKTDYITVYPYPYPKFISNLQIACAPATILFTDQSTPGLGSITSWTWEFGDGQTSNSPNPPHVYPGTGYYNVGLTVVNSGGCSTKIVSSRYIRVVPGVQPDFTWSQTSTSCSAPFDINFINQTSGPGTLTYKWDLGNGTSGVTQTNPSTSYPTNNPYTVNLTATSNFGCSATTSKTVSFQGNAPVITAPDNACLNTPVTFQNGSNPAPLSSSWDFGDGSTSTFPNPEKTYTAAGTYTVTLTNTYASCSSSSTKTINVTSSLPAQFTADKLSGCKTPTTINFTDQTTGGIGWLWDFGDGQTSTDKNPSHTYTSLNYYDVSLTVTTTSGCSNVLTKPKYIRLGTSIPTLVASSAQGCVNAPIKPSLTLASPDGIVSYLWTAQSASPGTSTDPSPTFTYTTEGNYDLSVQVTTNGGCSFSQNFPGAVVIGNQVPPAFTATATTSCARQPITFSFTPPASAPLIDKWLWKFGDGVTSPTGPSITHNYADTGFNDVTLTVTHHGCTLSHTEPKYIYINPPLAGFSYQIDCNTRTHVTFTDTSKFDPTKPAPAYQWDFDGDGTIDDVTASPVHDFPLPLKAWNVSLTITQGACSDKVTTTIDLLPITPSFTISPNPACKSSQFTLHSTSTPLAAIDSFTWTVNGVKRTIDNPDFITGIPDTGAHPISLVITDKGGCKYPAVINPIQITGPAAKFAAGIGGCKNNAITFADLSVAYRPDPANAITSWSWDFGDGNTGTGSPAQHTYLDTGTYDITLAIQDARGCVDTFKLPAAAKISSSKAGFFARDTVYCPTVAMPFTDTSKGNNLTYSWDFGDGAAAPTAPGSTDQNPTHAYANNGQYYSVKLKVTDGTGCSDSVTHTNYVHIQKPIAAFTLDDSTGICLPLQANFTPAGRYYDSLYWDFGDGQTSTLDTTAHYYNDYGKPADNYGYTARLILQGVGGCRDTAIRNVYVYQPFDLSTFTFTPIRDCDSVTATFSATPPPYTKYVIYFGDGAADSSGNLTPTHTYHGLGGFSPQLSLTDGSGCIVGINRGGITVLGAVPIYSTDKKAFCDNGDVAFQGIIVTNDGQSTYTWDFGDGTTLSATPTGQPDDPFLSQQHSYTGPGVRLASLKITTNSGCNETYTDTIHVWQTPHPLVTTEGTLCAGFIQFHGNVTIPNIDSVTYNWTFSTGPTSTAKDPFLQFPHGTMNAHLKTSVQFGCSDTTSLPVLINPLPEIKGPKLISTPVGIPVTLPFTYSPNVNTWTWSPSTYLDCTDCPNPVSTPTFNTTYLVTVKDANNCVSTDTVVVKTVCEGDNYFIPNTFSPNKDGVNDVFYPRGKGLHDIQSMRIFNRWGQLVFERKNFPPNSEAQGWDGTINGRPAPSDAYVYIIEVICINAQIIALKGDVTLIR